MVMRPVRWTRSRSPGPCVARRWGRRGLRGEYANADSSLAPARISVFYAPLQISVNVTYKPRIRHVHGSSGRSAKTAPSGFERAPKVRPEVRRPFAVYLESVYFSFGKLRSHRSGEVSRRKCSDGCISCLLKTAS